MSIAVIGSINIDIVFERDTVPSLGETANGQHYTVNHGGKGANQALLLKNQYDDVRFLGAVGDDVFAGLALENLAYKRLSTEHILKKKGPSGLALVELKDKDNAITVFPGANGELSEADVDVFFEDNPDLEWVVTQLEIPYKTVEYLIDEAHRQGIKVILNPTPVKPLPASLMDKCDYIVVNETEFANLYGNISKQKGIEDSKGRLIVTLGEQGVMYYDGGEIFIEPASEVEVVDTTGAGDSFIAGFTAGLALKKPIGHAVRQGIVLAARTVACRGAQCTVE